MVEAGAAEVPEDTLLEAFALAHGEIVKLCELSFVCLKVFDESLKGLSHELALANRG